MDHLKVDLTPDQPIVVLTGAGISKESGLDTFRDVDGIWARVNLEDVATPQAFARDPDLVHRFYNDRRRQLLTADVGPNAAHRALARLEAEWPGPVLVVTQNIDDLHDRAGSRALIHMHGELLKAKCGRCGAAAEARGDLSVEDACAACGRSGAMRPDVVWFGEMPYRMEEIAAALDGCGLFVSIGTSGTVYPAAGFVREARLAGRAYCLELNLDASDGAPYFHESRQGAATDLVPAFVEQVLARR